MKKIGKEVCFLKYNENISRNGEGAFIRLDDGKIMYAYTEYGNADHDNDEARICAIFSSDEGETWGEKRILIEKENDDVNIMSVSLLRMANGDVGLFFLRKRSTSCLLNLVRSSDECETFSSAIVCTDDADEENYYVVNNDRIIMLKSGRILYPANLHPYVTKKDISDISPKGIQLFYGSDDDGKTWKRLSDEIRHPFPNISSGLREGGVFEHENGEIFGWSRTRAGSQFTMYSSDGGETWTSPCASEVFTSPDSPMQVKNVGKYTVAIFNPIPMYTSRDPAGTWGRTPFICAVSTDNGRTFDKFYSIEDDLTNGYCYPAIFEGEDYFLVAYYHSDNTGFCLKSAKITKIMFSELEK